MKCVQRWYEHYDRVHTASRSVPDSSEPFASGRLRVGFAFTLLTTDPMRTVRVPVAVFKLRLFRDWVYPITCT